MTYHAKYSGIRTHVVEWPSARLLGPRPSCVFRDRRREPPQSDDFFAFGFAGMFSERAHRSLVTKKWGEGSGGENPRLYRSSPGVAVRGRASSRWTAGG